jgi:putative transposase
MDEKSERQLRRQAIRRLLRGEHSSRILGVIPRSREWLRKWWNRFVQSGWAGLKSRSRRPPTSCRRYGQRTRWLIVRARLALERSAVGLIGPDAVRTKLRQWRVRPLPSRATVARELRARKRTHRRLHHRATAYYPHPQPTLHYRLQATDWTAHTLHGGQPVYAFNTVTYGSRDLCSRVYGDKTVATVRAYVLSIWRSILGLPDGLQLDNDSAFIGGYRGRRVFGQFVRLCLYVGIEPIFIPFYEAKRNELVEFVNGLWQRAFWKRRCFRSLKDVQRRNPEFERWYRLDYVPPAFINQTPAQMARQDSGVRLTAAQARSIPSHLPITAGRVHFIRRVDAHGEINILNEQWRVGRRRAGQYVWATITTDRQRLDIYYRRSAQHPVRHLKSWRYALREAVVPLRPEFRRRARRRQMPTML